MSSKSNSDTDCDKCKKTIRNIRHDCMLCLKSFHPGCAKIHKIYDKKNALIPCTGKIEEIIVNPQRSEAKDDHAKTKNRKSTEGEIVAEGEEINLENNQVTKLAERVEKMFRKENEKLKNDIETTMFGKDLKEMIQYLIKTEIDKAIKILKEEIGDIKKLIITKHEEREKSKESIKYRKEEEKIEIEQKNNKQRLSYAETARNSSNKKDIIIQPVGEQTSEITEEMIKNKVDIMELGVGLNSVMKGSKGKIIIGCEKSKDREILAEALKEKLGTQYTIFAPKKRLPKLKIVGVEQKVESEEMKFLERVARQNDIDVKRDTYKMSIIKISRRKENRTMLILEVDPQTHKYLIEKKKMKVGWNICPVYDYVSVTRCFKCWGFNHFAADCKNELCCKRCGGTHDSQNCSSNIKKCTNCTKMIVKYKLDNLSDKHEATDIECESYKIMVNRNRRNILYGEE